MFSELTNLLPKDLLAAFHRDYYLRVAVVAVSMVAVLVVIHGVLLIPSYLYVQQQLGVQKEALARLAQAKVSDTENQLNQRLGNISSEATYLSGLSKTPTSSGVIQAILAVPRPGIQISGFSFASQKGAQPSLQITGVASTRETLRSYDQALSALPFVSNVNLPISDYAQANNINFSIDLTGTLLPQ
jgi:hypothetical protein